MIPRLIASAPRLTKICRPTAARAITCQKRVGELLSPSSLSKACSCVGTSTLASSSVAFSGGPSDGVSVSRHRSRRRRQWQKQQRRSNSISSSVAAAVLGNNPRLTVGPALHYGVDYLDSDYGDMRVDIPKRISRHQNGTVGRRRDERRRHQRHDVDAALVQDLLAQLAQQQQQQQQPPAKEKFQVPSIDVARSMPLSCQQMDNTSLMCLAALNVVEARSEVLRRHIMDVDSVSYKEACKTYEEIRDYNRAGLLLHAIPYKVGITTAALAAFASIPLCFHLPTVEYFNANFVTAEIPDPEQLQTWWGVGAWSWAWMEPPLGQLSFMILCLQCARNQLGTIGHKPYGGVIKQWRADRLVKAYPKYDEQILDAYSKSVPLISGNYR